MKYPVNYEFDDCLAVIDAILSGRDYSTIPTDAATTAWFTWSALAASGEWA